MTTVIAREFDADLSLRRIIEAVPAICRDEAELIKADGRGRVYRIESYGYRLAVKWFPALGATPGRTLRRLTKGRWGASIWRRARNAYERGLPLATPIGFHQPWSWHHEAYLVFQWIDGPTISAMLSDESVPFATRVQVAAAVGELIGSMHQSGISHGDLKARNILVAGKTPVLIDPDAIRIHRVSVGLKKRARRDWKTIVASLNASPVDSRLVMAMTSADRGPEKPVTR